MKTFNRLISALLVLSVLCGAATAQKSFDIDSLIKEIAGEISHNVLTMPVDISIGPVQLPSSPGPVSLKLTVSPNFCKELTGVIITKIDRVQYSGDMSWSFSTIPKDTFEVILDLVIPPNDTSGLEFEVICDEWSMPFYAYFHTTDGRVKFYQFNHRIPFPSSKHKAPKTTIDMSDPTLTEEQKQGKISVGYEDEDGNWTPIDSVQSSTGAEVSRGDRSKIWVRGQDGKQIKVDTVWLFDSLRQAKTQAQLEEMRRREQQPCTLSGERFVVGDQIWQRKEGEYKFRLAITTTDPVKRGREIADSLRALAPDTAYHVSLDLRTKEDYDFVKGNVDSLLPMEREGYYHVRVKRDVVGIWNKSGIKTGIYPYYPGDIPFMPPKKKILNSTSNNVNNSASQISVVFGEDFETVWPGPWTVRDTNAANGLDYWGKLHHTVGWVYSGDSSAWCATVGDMPDGQSYDDNMEAQMFTTNIIWSLEGYDGHLVRTRCLLCGYTWRRELGW